MTVRGPLFISIGDEEKLNVFLDKNPYIPRDQAFVDGYDFNAYTSAGFGRLDEVDKEEAKKVKLGAPDIGISGWLNYFGTVIKLSPIPPDMKFGEIPEGVLRLGGTYVIRDDQIVYRWSDRLPGDHPNIEEVMDIANEAAKKSASSPFSFDSLFSSFK